MQKSIMETDEELQLENEKEPVEVDESAFNLLGASARPKKKVKAKAKKASKH